MIVTKILDKYQNELQKSPATRYSILNNKLLRYYGEFVFNHRKWRVYQVGPGDRFRISGSTTFINEVINKYGFWSSVGGILDLDTVPIVNSTFGTYYSFEIEVFNTEFVMFG